MTKETMRRLEELGWGKKRISGLQPERQ